MTRSRLTMRSGPWLLLIVTLSAQGCVDYARIRGIVEESNTLSTILADSRDLTAGWQHAEPDARPSDLETRRARIIETIDEYISTHADQTATINALRVRKALVYLTAGETNAALATFDDVQRDALATDRDRGLFDARRPLVWWQRVGPATTDLPADGVFEARLEELDAAINRLPRGTDIRDYLAAIRAYVVGKRVAAHAQDTAAADPMLRAGLRTYIAEFDDADRCNIQRLMGPPDGQPADFPPGRLRAYIHSTTVARYYVEVAEPFGVAIDTWTDVAWLVELGHGNG